MQRFHPVEGADIAWPSVPRSAMQHTRRTTSTTGLLNRLSRLETVYASRQPPPECTLSEEAKAELFEIARAYDADEMLSDDAQRMIDEMRASWRVER